MPPAMLTAAMLLKSKCSIITLVSFQQRVLLGGRHVENPDVVVVVAGSEPGAIRAERAAQHSCTKPRQDLLSYPVSGL